MKELKELKEIEEIIVKITNDFNAKRGGKNNG